MILFQVWFTILFMGLNLGRKRNLNIREAKEWAHLLPLIKVVPYNLSSLKI